jgi:hypothetical protein
MIRTAAAPSSSSSSKQCNYLQVHLQQPAMAQQHYLLQALLLLLLVWMDGRLLWHLCQTWQNQQHLLCAAHRR